MSNNFKDFGIVVKSKGFEGDKIKIDRILNKQIVVENFKIEKSNFEKGNGNCLHLQISIEGSKRVLFSGSKYLMEMIQEVPKDKLPFNTTIVKNNDRLEFT